MLTGASGDFRVERGTDGSLILRADGCLTGSSLSRHGSGRPDRSRSLVRRERRRQPGAWPVGMRNFPHGQKVRSRLQWLNRAMLGTGHHPSIALAFGLIEASSSPSCSNPVLLLTANTVAAAVDRGAAAARTHPSTGAKPDPLPRKPPGRTIVRTGDG